MESARTPPATVASKTGKENSRRYSNSVNSARSTVTDASGHDTPESGSGTESNNATNRTIAAARMRFGRSPKCWYNVGLLTPAAREISATLSTDPSSWASSARVIASIRAVRDRSVRGLTSTASSADCAAVIIIPSHRLRLYTSQLTLTSITDTFTYVSFTSVKVVCRQQPVREFIYVTTQPKSPVDNYPNGARFYSIDLCQPSGVVGQRPHRLAGYHVCCDRQRGLTCYHRRRRTYPG